MDNKQEFKPYVPAEKITPELTVTSVIMGILLAVIFGLGLLTTVLTNKNDSIAREALKSELKEELLKELTSSEN